jgi:DNA-binding NarL/FixJ family response regulator
MLEVIIADDHSLFREGFERILRSIKKSRTVHHAENGKQVVELLKQHTVDLIFMDIRMSELNGIETTFKVKQQYPNIKIIAISMMDDKSNIIKMFKAGADGYLLKNTSISEIQLAIDTVLQDKKYYSEAIERIIADTGKTEDIPSIKPYQAELSKREIEIIGLICQSYTNKEIGEILNIAEKTVSSHREHIYHKLGLEKVVDLIFYAIDSGIIKKIINE